MTYKSIIAKAKSEYEPVPPGDHIGRCYSLVVLGTSTEQFDGKDREIVSLISSNVHPNTTTGSPKTG